MIMEYIIALLVSAIFVFFGAIGFYHAFKRYHSEDDFLYGFLDFDPSFLSLIGELILWISNKKFPEKIHVKIYKITAFIFGIVMFSVAALVWILLI